MSQTTSRKNWLSVWLGISVAVVSIALMSGCAATPSPNAAGPNTAAPTYPILLIDDEGDRKVAALAAWASLTSAQGIKDAPPPEIRPVTATLRSIPASLQVPLHLPRVGESLPMNEDESREALRRFIADAGPLLCGDPQQLSLIQRIDGADGVKQARYQQRPFRYGIRGGFGELTIGFRADGSLAAISSTCIPDTERIRRGFVGLSQQRLPIEKIYEGLRNQTVSYLDSNGQQQSYTITEKDQLLARELVVYPIERPGEPVVIEIHSAWEIGIENSSGLTLYVDSIMGEILEAKRLPNL